MKEIWRAWAIDSRSNEGHGFLGVYFMNYKLRLGPCQQGNMIALFKTRKQAREWLWREKTKPYQAFPKMAVVRVAITLEAK